MMRGLFFFLACFSLIATPAAAAERRVALVIGNSAYETVPPLANPRNDAADVAAALGELGFEVVEGFDLDHAGMTQAVQDYARLLEGADIALFFYAGHGLQVEGRNFMAPVDAAIADRSSLEFETVDMSLVLDRMEAQPRVNIIFLDACRDNPLTRSLGSGRSGGTRGLAQMNSSAVGTLIAYSTQPGAVASDGAGRNSPFTTALLTQIRTPGLEVQRMLRRVRAAVMEGSDGAQIPWDHSSLTDDFFFTPPPAGFTGLTHAAPEVGPLAPMELSDRQIEVRLWNDVKDTGSASQIESYLDAYPEGVFAGVARARIDDINGGGMPGVEAIEALFSAIASRSIVVEEPTEAHEFYANARIYELQGDYLNARRSYASLFGLGVEHVDPHYRYQAFLRVQEGRAGAREIYNEMAYARAEDEMIAYAAALLLERDARVERLDAWIADHPDFAPAYYDLSRDFSLARLGQQSMSDKQRERELLTRFIELSEDGAFLRWFIDQELAARQIEDAEERLAALSLIQDSAFENPVRLTAMRSNAGWMLTFLLADRAQEIFVALPGEEFVSTGVFNGAVDPTTGLAMPNTTYALPGHAEETTVRVRYTDLRGDMHGPFELSFDPSLALVEGQKSILELLPTGWVSFRDWDGELLAYFTHLVTYRCAIEEVRYAVDGETPDTVFPLEACDPDNPNGVGGASSIYFAIPDGSQFMTVELDYRDGTSSRVQRFEVR